MKMKTKKQKLRKTYEMVLKFDNKEAAENYLAYFLDGGGDGGGNMDFYADEWEIDAKFIRIKGTGYFVNQNGEVMTPEMESADMERRLKNIRENCTK